MLSSETILTTELRVSKESHSGSAPPQPLNKSKTEKHPKSASCSLKSFIELLTISEAPVRPFAGVTIGDPNNVTNTLVITFAGSGSLADGAGFQGLFFGGTGFYTLSGTAAAIKRGSSAGPAPGSDSVMKRSGWA